MDPAIGLFCLVFCSPLLRQAAARCNKAVNPLSNPLPSLWTLEARVPTAHLRDSTENGPKNTENGNSEALQLMDVAKWSALKIFLKIQHLNTTFDWITAFHAQAISRRIPVQALPPSMAAVRAPKPDFSWSGMINPMPPAHSPQKHGRSHWFLAV